MNYELFPFAEFERLTGGLRTKIIPCRTVKDAEVLDQESQCSNIIEFDPVRWELDEDRKHYRLLNQGIVEYFPSLYCQPNFNHKITQYDWNTHINYHKPDPDYARYLKKVINIHLKGMYYHLHKGIYSELDGFRLAKTLYHISWLDPVSKRSLFIYIAHLLRRQSELKNILLENAHNRHEDGLRLLLTIALTVGSTVETLLLWNFFITGVMPLNIGYAENMNDPFILTRDLKKRVPEEEKARIWNEHLMKNYYDLPHDYFHYFTIFLKSFTNLSKLYCNYCWIALGQGVTLNLLASIRNGKLKDLYLLCNSEDMPYNSGCMVSPRAWIKAKQKCPHLKVHLVVMNVTENYDDNLTLLQEEMPLMSYALKAALPITDYKKVKEHWYDCLLRTLIYKYNQTLRRVNIEVWHPRSRVDVMIAAFLNKLPFLENFEYSGAFDKIDTIEEICEYLLNYQTRLKFIKLLVREDPCFPQKYRDAVETIRKEYTHKLYDCGITFYVGTLVI